MAPAGSAMRRDGDAVRNDYEARGIFNSGSMIRDLIYVANDYGWDWDCNLNAFALEEVPTTSSGGVPLAV